MNSPILGIDVSKDSLDVQLIIADTSQQTTFENTPKGHKQLLRWLQKHCGQRQVHVCLEATGQYAFPVAEVLHAAEQLVSLVNPARISAYAKSKLARNKTDRLDAGIIADFCRTQSPPAWYPPREELRELQTLVRLLEDLKATRQNLLFSDRLAQERLVWLPLWEWRLSETNTPCVTTASSAFCMPCPSPRSTV